MKIWNNIKQIYRGIQHYLFGGLKFASVGASKTVSIIAATIIVALLIGAVVIEAIFWLLYKATELIEERTSPNVKIRKSYQLIKQNI